MATRMSDEDFEALETMLGLAPKTPSIQVAQQWYEDLKAERILSAALQCHIDQLMLEYCPGEMTEEQIANWGEHQVPVSAAEQAELNKSLENSNEKQG